MYVSVDIGFGFVKVMTSNGKKLSFPSVMTPRTGNTLRGIVGGTGDDFEVLYWEESSNGEREHEKKLFVGDAGLTNGGTRKWEDKNVELNSDDLKIMISTAVASVNPNNESVDLCVGLPMSYFLQKNEELTVILKSLEGRIQFANSKTHVINFESVFCFPQGAGAYYDAFLDSSGDIMDYELASSSVGVIDVGFRTVDYLYMGKGRTGVTMIDRLSGSFEEDGMNKAFQDIERSVSADLGKEIGMNEIEKSLLWFDGSLTFKGQKINLIPYEESAHSSLAESITSKLKLKWGADADNLSAILVTGGGGNALFPVLRDKFEQAELQEDCSFANCRGYMKALARKINK